jgi:hypothetical protein
MRPIMPANKPLGQPISPTLIIVQTPQKGGKQIRKGQLLLSDTFWSVSCAKKGLFF